MVEGEFVAIPQLLEGPSCKVNIAFMLVFSLLAGCHSCLVDDLVSKALTIQGAGFLSAVTHPLVYSLGLVCVAFENFCIVFRDSLG